MCDAEATKPVTDPDVLNALVGSHRSFLRFLERRVESAAIAEEILQNAFVKTIEKGAELRDGENAMAWFYRLLRNALVDYYRRRDVESRGLAREAREIESTNVADDSEIENVICGCMRQLLPGLKPEYADVLNQVDLEGKSISEFALAQGITENNASVRLHRSRLALKKQLEKSCGTCAAHGCLDCSCGG